MPRKNILYRPYFLTVDKPAGLTSHDVVGILRAVTGVSKIGHTGTLDPFATGVLPIALGTATRLIQFLPEEKKKYLATLQLGSSTDTADKTGEILKCKDIPTLDEDGIRRALASFVGRQSQKPPAYAAIKVNGKKLYQYAREGITIDVPKRSINVFEIHYVSHSDNSITFVSSVSKGTYIRALGEDIATKLGTLGHLSSLRRIESGPFCLDNAINFSKIANIVCGVSDWHSAFKAPRENRLPRTDRSTVKKMLFPYMMNAFQVFQGLPQHHLSEAEHAWVVNGRVPLELQLISESPLCLSFRDRIVALCTLTVENSEKKWKLSRVISSSAVSILYEHSKSR